MITFGELVVHVRTLVFLLLSLSSSASSSGAQTLVWSHQNGGDLGLLPSFTVLSSLPPLGAVQIRYFQLTLTTPREGPNRPTRKRTLFRRKRKTSNKKRNETYKKRTSFQNETPGNPADQMRDQRSCTQGGAQATHISVVVCITGP